MSDLDILSSFSLSVSEIAEELLRKKLNKTKIIKTTKPIKIFGLNTLSVLMISTNFKLLPLSSFLFFLTLTFFIGFF